MEFYKQPLFFHECQIGKPSNVHWCNILRSSYMKFHPIWFRGYREMALAGQTDGHSIDGRTDRQTDKSATICSPLHAAFNFFFGSDWMDSKANLSLYRPQMMALSRCYSDETILGHLCLRLYHSNENGYFHNNIILKYVL